MANGEIYAHFDQAFSDYVFPPGQTVNSGTFGNLKLVKGALASLQVIPWATWTFRQLIPLEWALTVTKFHGRTSTGTMLRQHTVMTSSHLLASCLPLNL